MEAENKSEANKVEKLVSNVIECAETRFDLVAIDVQEKVSDILSSIASIAILGVMAIFALLLLSVGTAMFVSQQMESPFIGFFFVAAFYIILGLILYVKRRNWIMLPIINALLKKINFHEEN